MNSEQESSLLYRILTVTSSVRKSQKAYFKERSNQILIASKELERELDLLLMEAEKAGLMRPHQSGGDDAPAQLSLWGRNG